MLMGYYNPILAYGADRFVQHAAGAGANGFIIPDLPPEEAGDFLQATRAQGLGMSFLLAPNSPEDRIVRVSQCTTGFTYLVSVTGITGARAALPPQLAGFVTRVRAHSQTPLAVGFGISTPAQARAVGELADGVIVGSALIKVVQRAQNSNENPPTQARRFVESLKSALA